MKDNWNSSPLRDLVKTMRAGGTPSSTNPEYYNGEIPFVSIEDITDSNKRLKKTKKFLSKKGIDASAAWVIPKGYLVYSMYASVGKVRHLDIDAATSQAIIAINSDPSIIDKDYLYYFLLKLESEIYKYTSQTTQANLNAEKVKSFEIVYPPLPQQHKIAEILSTVDAVIEKTEAAITKYQQLKQGLMHDLFTRGIDENTGQLRPKQEDAPELYKRSALGWIPKEWEIKRIDEIGEVISGGTPSSNVASFWNGNILWITPSDLSKLKSSEISNSQRKITKLGLGNSSALLIPKNSIVISSRAPIGYCAIVNQEFTTNQGCKSISLNCENDSFYFYFNIMQHISRIKIKGEGTTFAEISKKELEKIKFSVAAKEEQVLIARKLQAIDQKIHTEQQTLAKYQQLKAGLMQDLLSGEVEVSV